MEERKGFSEIDREIIQMAAAHLSAYNLAAFLRRYLSMHGASEADMRWCLRLVEDSMGAEARLMDKHAEKKRRLNIAAGILSIVSFVVSVAAIIAGILL